MTTNLAERLMIDKLKWNKSTAETRWHARWWICLIHWNYRVDFIKRIFGSLVHVFRFWWSSSLIWAKSKLTFARFNWLFSKQFPIHSGTMCSGSSVKMIRKHRNIGKMHFKRWIQTEMRCCKMGSSKSKHYHRIQKNCIRGVLSLLSEEVRWWKRIENWFYVLRLLAKYTMVKLSCCHRWH